MSQAVLSDNQTRSVTPAGGQEAAARFAGRARKRSVLLRRRWTADDCAAMVAAGVLEAGTFELIEGDVISKMSQNVPHVFVVGRLFLALVGVFGGDYVQSQAPIRVSRTTEPEPDVSVLDHPLSDFLALGTPPASEARLVVEVSNTTLATDSTIKALLYARAGIPEYWVVDVENRVFLVHRAPSFTGYNSRVSVSADETLSPLARPDAVLRVADLLPPQ